MNQQNSQELMKCIVRAADDRLGQDILALDVQNLTPLADYFVLVTAKNDRQLHSGHYRVWENWCDGSAIISRIRRTCDWL